MMSIKDVPCFFPLNKKFTSVRVLCQLRMSVTDLKGKFGLYDISMI